MAKTAEPSAVVRNAARSNRFAVSRAQAGRDEGGRHGRGKNGKRPHLSRARPSVRFRKATAADSEFAFQAKKVTLARYVKRVWGWDEAEQRRMHRTRFAAQEFRVIRVSGTDVGILASARESDHLRVYQLLILPQHQRQGAGTSIMSRIIRDAAVRQVPVRLQVLKVNRRAIRFYRKLGFSITGRDDTHFQMERPPGGTRS